MFMKICCCSAEKVKAVREAIQMKCFPILLTINQKIVMYPLILNLLVGDDVAFWVAAKSDKVDY